ncbi:2OG-Fe(II) oxygenase [Nocardia lijiangensis]|uniref:2OG-Fe(II) oxygenase n=1 Tax=Nocardia lijiangensis TaxID=299618 RepID=UPI003D705E59
MQQPFFSTHGKPPELGECRTTSVVTLRERIGAVRVEQVFSEDATTALASFLQNDLVYERDEIGDQKLVNRASRQGEMPDDPLVHRATASTAEAALAVLGVFGSAWFIEQLEKWLSTPLRVLRPPTPYRMDVGDHIEPHDDHPSSEFRLSVTYNLTADWQIGDGGETVIGDVAAVTEFEDPDFPLPLKKWTLAPGAQSLTPVFNSALLLPLSCEQAHAVRPVQRAARFSITTLYGDRIFH